MSLWFFRTWGGGGGGGGSVSSSGHPAGMCSADCTLKSWPWPGLGVFWVIHIWVFSGSPSGSECGVLCFRHGDVVLRDLSCSSVGGLHCHGPVNARQIAWETVVACGVRSGFPGPLRATHRWRCVPFLFPQVVTCR